MAGHNDLGQGKAPKLAVAALILGVVSIILIPVTVFLGVRFEVIGIVNLFRNLVFPVSIAAIVAGIIARRSTAPERSQGRTAASLGLTLGAASFGLTLLTVTVIALFFSFLLFKH